jgi:hypothetical protein
MARKDVIGLRNSCKGSKAGAFFVAWRSFVRSGPSLKGDLDNKRLLNGIVRSSTCAPIAFASRKSHIRSSSSAHHKQTRFGSVCRSLRNGRGGDGAVARLTQFGVNLTRRLTLYRQLDEWADIRPQTVDSITPRNCYLKRLDALYLHDIDNICHTAAAKPQGLCSLDSSRCFPASETAKVSRACWPAPWPRRLAEGHAPLSQSVDSRGALLGSRIGMVSCLQLTCRGESDVRAG